MKLKCLWLLFFSSTVLANYHLINKDGHQIHVLEISPKAYKIVAVSAKDEVLGRATVSSLVEKHGAYAGINGGFFHIFDAKGSPAGALKINGQWLGFPVLPRGAIGWDSQNNQVAVDRILTRRVKEKIQVLPQNDKSLAAKNKWQDFDMIVGGTPLLIQQGKIFSDHSPEKTIPSFLNERHARTAVCLKKNHDWVLLVADKRPLGGLTIPELTKTLKDLNCEAALNLDGGGSSTLVVDGKVMNQDAGDKDEDSIYHQRPVTDAILILPRNI